MYINLDDWIIHLFHSTCKISVYLSLINTYWNIPMSLPNVYLDYTPNIMLLIMILLGCIVYESWYKIRQWFCSYWLILICLSFYCLCCRAVLNYKRTSSNFSVLFFTICRHWHPYILCCLHSVYAIMFWSKLIYCSKITNSWSISF